MIKSKLLLSLALFITSFSLAQPSSQAIKGLYNNMPTEYRYLSPIQGFNIFKSGQIQSWYHFQKKIKGAPDPFFQLINQLFHAPVKLIKASNTPAKLFPPDIIATILLYLPTKQDLDDLERIAEETISQAKESKKTAIDIPFQSYTLMNIPLPPKPYMEKILIEYTKEIKKKLESIITKNENIRIKLKNNPSSSSLLKDVISYSVDLAVKSTKGEYPDYIAHQIFLAFLWVTIETKKDLKGYFDALHRVYNTMETKKEETIISFLHDMEATLSDSYSESELNEIKNELVEKAYAHTIDNTFLMENYEKLNALFGYLKEIRAPLLSGVIEVVLGKRGFTDCGEATIRNIINVALFQKTMFDMDGLKKILLNEKYKNHTDPTAALAKDLFVQFFERYGTIASTFNPVSRSEWSELLSNIEGVDYGIFFPHKEQERFACEIKGRAGINNLLLVLEHILFPDSFTPASDQNERIKKVFDTLAISKKLTAEFQPANAARGWGDLIILVDGVPSFNISIEEKHFEMLPIKGNSSSTDSWWEMLSDTLLRSVDEQNKTQSLGILGWIEYGPHNVTTTIENGYRLISESNLKNQVSKNNFFAWWLLTLPLDNFLVREEMILALDNIPHLFEDIAKAPPILYYLQLINPTLSFIQSELKNKRIKYLSALIKEHASENPDTALLVIEKILFYLKEIGMEEKEESVLKKYEKLEWAKEIKNWTTMITEKANLEKLGALNKLTRDVISNFKKLNDYLQKKNKKIPKQVNSMLDALQALENNIEKLLTEKKKEAEEGLIGELF